MISIVTCECGSSEGLVRQALHRYKYKKWGTEPITKGKTQSLQVVEDLLRKYPRNPQLEALFSHINNTGKWAVILGYNDSGVKWSDISHNDMQSDVDAELIVENFSNLH